MRLNTYFVKEMSHISCFFMFNVDDGIGDTTDALVFEFIFCIFGLDNLQIAEAVRYL